jgi:hypothetical protein
LLRELLTRHPFLIVFDIAALATAVGFVLVLIREVALFRGYREIKRVAKGIATKVQGSIFRDSADLVINGSYRGIPVVVRFSTAENTPDINLWMRVDSQFNLFVAHSSAQVTEGRVRVLTGDRWFDERFTVRTDNRDAVMAFLSDPSTVADLKQLCCSPGTFTVLGKESLELSESTTPQVDTLQHLVAHLETLARCAIRVGTLSNPGAASRKAYLPDRSVVARVGLGLLALAAIVEVATAVHSYHADELAVTSSSAPQPSVVVSPADIVQLPASAEWRLAEPSDFDATMSAWFAEHKQPAKSRFDGGFTAAGPSASTAYVFVRAKQPTSDMWRIVMFSQHRIVLDVAMSDVLAVVRVPKAVLETLEWQEGQISPEPSDGDGLMVVRKVGDDREGVIFTLSGGKAQSRKPASILSVANLNL